MAKWPMFVLFFFVFRGSALYLLVFPVVDKRKLTEIAVLTSVISLSGLSVIKSTGLTPKSLISSPLFAVILLQVMKHLWGGAGRVSFDFDVCWVIEIPAGYNGSFGSWIIPATSATKSVFARGPFAKPEVFCSNTGGHGDLQQAKGRGVYDLAIRGQRPADFGSDAWLALPNRGSIFLHLICRSIIHANSSIQCKKIL